MKLYLTHSRDSHAIMYTEFASSDANASKCRTKLKALGRVEIKTEAHDVPTTRDGLINFLNGQFAE